MLSPDSDNYDHHGRHKRGHGGPRNWRDRVSHAIPYERVLLLRDAWAFADWMQKTLNFWLTIHWACLGVTDNDAGARLHDFLAKVRQFLTKKGHFYGAIYMREAGLTKGTHVHILLYLPPEQIDRFRKRQRKWLEQVTGKRYKYGAIRGMPVRNYLKRDGRPSDPQSNSALDAVSTNSLNCLRYGIKGADRNAARHWELDKLQSGGDIIGKRVGTSDSLGRAAMAEAGFISPLVDPITGEPASVFSGC